MFEISVLGPLEVMRDGVALKVPAGKTSELLVRLALDAGTVVRTDRLLDDLWGDAAVTTRRNTLQSKVAMLRRALGDPSLLAGTDGGYVLAVDPSEVDALEVRRHLSTASELIDAGEDRAAAEVCASTLRMFRGDVLPAAGDGDWVAPRRALLEEVRVELLRSGLSARSRLGGGDIVGELEAAVATYPLQEGLWELLITALYRAGRQADALAAYQRVRSQLADELGLDPGPGLQKLERRILAHDPALGGSTPTLGRDAPAGNLPSLSAELVGREADVATVLDLLAGRRLVEIVGPGGVGKTALAIATGRSLASSTGGVWLARLETAATADDVVDSVIAALHVTGGESALFDRLRSAATVLIFDNCEQVVDAAADLAVRLLDAASDLRILCTSQVPLDVDGEVVFELAPLSLIDSIELFARRAGAQRRQPTPDDTVADLCRALDGLPLAIELAAARTRTLSVKEITRRLDDRFSVLSDPASRRPQRRRALKATIQWSYELLFPDDQRGLWALSIFADGAPLAAVEHVLEGLDVPGNTAIDVVGRLASRSLVIVDRGDGSMPVRYRLLDSIRAFSLEALGDAGLSQRALAAHAGWFAGAACSSTDGVRSSRQAEHLAFARAERANIDAALAWSTVHDPLFALGIVNGFGWAWVVLGDSRGAQRILAALDSAGSAAPAGERAHALLLAAWIEASTGNLDLARTHVTDATSLAKMIGDVDLQARAAYYLAYVVSHSGAFREAMALTDRSRTLYTGLDRPWDQAANGLFAARAAISAGDDERGAEALAEVDHWLRTVEDPWLHVRRDAALGELARIQRRFDDAVAHIGRAADASGRLGFRQTEAYQLSSLGRAQCQAGDYDAGAATLTIAVGKAEATGDVRLAALARVHLGRVLRALGHTAPARAALEHATAWHRDAGGGELAALGECLLAAMDAEAGSAGADARLTAILEEAQRAGDAPVEVFALDALARAAAHSGDMATARQLSVEADRRMAAADNFITDRDRTDAHAVTQMASARPTPPPAGSSG